MSYSCRMQVMNNYMYFKSVKYYMCTSVPRLQHNRGVKYIYLIHTRKERKVYIFSWNIYMYILVHNSKSIIQTVNNSFDEIMHATAYN